MIGSARARRASAAAALLALAACAAGRPRPPAAAEAAPLEVTRAFYRALHAGDAASAARLVDGPRAGEATAAFVQLARAYEALEQAMVARFGREAGRAVGYAERVAAEEDALRSARAEVEGDRAAVLSGERPLAVLRRVDGAWKVVLEEALAGEQGLAALEREAEASAAAAEKVAPAVRGGLFDSVADALEAFRNEVEIARGGVAPGAERPEEATSPPAEQAAQPPGEGPEL